MIAFSLVDRSSILGPGNIFCFFFFNELIYLCNYIISLDCSRVCASNIMIKGKFTGCRLCVYLNIFDSITYDFNTVPRLKHLPVNGFAVYNNLRQRECQRIIWRTEEWNKKSCTFQKNKKR